MASKQPTVIDEVVGGKIVSVTICHECHDVSIYVNVLIFVHTYVSIACTYKVSENLESFFDISLTMPEETLPKVSYIKYPNS